MRMTDMSAVHEFVHALFLGRSCSKSSTGAGGFFTGAGVFVVGAGEGGAKTGVCPPLIRTLSTYLHQIIVKQKPKIVAFYYTYVMSTVRSTKCRKRKFLEYMNITVHMKIISYCRIAELLFM